MTWWGLALSLGCGIYSHPSNIEFNSILVNGGCIIIYDINPSLSVGVGIGLTNSFGVPMVMPTGYLKWVARKKFEFDVDMTSHNAQMRNENTGEYSNISGKCTET